MLLGPVPTVLVKWIVPVPALTVRPRPAGVEVTAPVNVTFAPLAFFELRLVGCVRLIAVVAVSAIAWSAVLIAVPL
jgi:hypothetical protein